MNAGSGMVQIPSTDIDRVVPIYQPGSSAAYATNDNGIRIGLFDVTPPVETLKERGHDESTKCYQRLPIQPGATFRDMTFSWSEDNPRHPFMQLMDAGCLSVTQGPDWEFQSYDRIPLTEKIWRGTVQDMARSDPEMQATQKMAKLNDQRRAQRLSSLRGCPYQGAQANRPAKRQRPFAARSCIVQPNDTQLPTSSSGSFDTTRFSRQPAHTAAAHVHEALGVASGAITHSPQVIVPGMSGEMFPAAVPSPLAENRRHSSPSNAVVRAQDSQGSQTVKLRPSPLEAYMAMKRSSPTPNVSAALPSPSTSQTESEENRPATTSSLPSQCPQESPVMASVHLSQDTSAGALLASQSRDMLAVSPSFLEGMVDNYINQEGQDWRDSPAIPPDTSAFQQFMTLTPAWVPPAQEPQTVSPAMLMRHPQVAAAESTPAAAPSSLTQDENTPVTTPDLFPDLLALGRLDSSEEDLFGPRPYPSAES